MKAEEILLFSAAQRIGVSRAATAALALSLATNAMLAFALATQDPEPQTIVIPSAAEANAPAETWRFTTSGPNAAYLERWALMLAGEIANLSPATAEASVTRLLEHVDPAVHAKLEKRLLKEAAALKADDAALAFYPTGTAVSESSLTVDVAGTSLMMIGSTVTERKEKILRFEFEHRSGRLFLEALSEVDRSASLFR